MIRSSDHSSWYITPMTAILETTTQARQAFQACLAGNDLIHELRHCRTPEVEQIILRLNRVVVQIRTRVPVAGHLGIWEEAVRAFEKDCREAAQRVHLTTEHRFWSWTKWFDTRLAETERPILFAIKYELEKRHVS